MIKSDSTPFSALDGYYAFGVSTDITDKHWILDSGASVHVCSNVGLMHSLSKLDEVKRIYLPDGSIQIVEYIGMVQLSPCLRLDNVLFAPRFTHNLISVAQLAKEMDIKCTFLDTHCVIQRRKRDVVLGFAKASGRLYVFEYNSDLRANSIGDMSKFIALDWHKMLGHVSFTTMQHMEGFQGLCTADVKKAIESCETCHKSKQCRNPFPLKQHRTDHLFELIHMDLWGPYHAETVTNTPFVLTIVEDHSRSTWTFLLSSKSQVCGVLKEFIQMIYTQFGLRIKQARSDNGSEFVNRHVQHLFTDNGILHQRSCTFSPQQNGVVERKHRTLLQVARALMFQSHLPMKFWSHSILFATWIMNRLPSQLLGWKSPYSMLYNKDVDFGNFIPFGCLVYATENSPSKAKFDSRSITCVMLGYASEHKAYILYDVHDTLIHTEILSPSAHSDASDLAPEVSADAQPAEDANDDDIALMPSPGITTGTSLSSPDDCVVVEPCIAVNKGKRSCKPPAWMNDFTALCHDDFEFKFQPGVPAVTPLTFPFVVSPIFTPSYVSFLVRVTELKEPSSYQEACKFVEWVEAMNSEIEALECNGTWTLSDLPPDKTAIGSKWVYKIKLASDGKVERFKARLVAKGYKQEYGVDYDEVFSPVAKLVSVRFLFALSASKGWVIHQIDINNAFLHGHLHEDIYMLLPQGYTGAPKGKVCKLIKSLYGLKQASREWNAEFCSVLHSYGFTQSDHDQCLFTMGHGQSFLCLLVYVDDVLIAGANEDDITRVKDFLHDRFTIKNLGPAKFFLGMEVARGSGGISLCQRQYILNLLDTMGMTGCRVSSTPLPSGVQLSGSSTDLFPNPEQYRRLIGQLLYLNLTRPDVAFAVQQLSQFVNSPRMVHWESAVHVLRYLKGCSSLGLFYRADSTISLLAYSDADWGTCLDTRRSLTGFCVFLGTSLISWRCKKQTTIALSTAESEYRALSSVARELQWLSYLCGDLLLNLPLPLPVYCDNLAAIQITKNSVFHERTKHLDIDCHHVRGLYKAGFLVPFHIRTVLQLADIFTKNLSGPRFFDLLSKMGLVDFHRLHLEGGVLSL